MTPGQRTRTSSTVAATSVRVPATGSLTATLPPASEIEPSAGFASSSARAPSSAVGEGGLVDGDDGRLVVTSGEV